MFFGRLGWRWIDFDGARHALQPRPLAITFLYASPAAALSFQTRTSAKTESKSNNSSEHACLPADDVWNFGMFVYEVVCGEPYFATPTEAEQQLTSSMAADYRVDEKSCGVACNNMASATRTWPIC